MEKLLSELTKNCEGKTQKLLDLLKIFDLATLGYDLQEQRCKDIYNRVLAENEFYCTRDFSHAIDKKIGERITREEDTFMLSEEDWNKLWELAKPIMVAEKICDERGFYVENWLQKIVDARKELVDFLLTEIVPAEMRKKLDACRWNIVYSDKLIDAFRSSLR